MTELAMSVIGWAGAILLLIPYLLVSTGRLSGQSIKYQVLNIFGSSFLFVNTVYHGAIPTAFVNIVWAIIGLFALRAALMAAKSQKDA
ncbi:MAG: hypothetical protein COA69_00135 [Robiginitomaculum sp.]|nr:MAG: hypothetical protein COA69_00135 [Robiginitomaculum sp.]